MVSRKKSEATTSAVQGDLLSAEVPKDYSFLDDHMMAILGECIPDASEASRSNTKLVISKFEPLFSSWNRDRTKRAEAQMAFRGKVVSRAHITFHDANASVLPIGELTLSIMLLSQLGGFALPKRSEYEAIVTEELRKAKTENEDETLRVSVFQVDDDGAVTRFYDGFGKALKIVELEQETTAPKAKRKYTRRASSEEKTPKKVAKKAASAKKKSGDPNAPARGRYAGILSKHLGRKATSREQGEIATELKGMGTNIADATSAQVKQAAKNLNIKL